MVRFLYKSICILNAEPCVHSPDLTNPYTEKNNLSTNQLHAAGPCVQHLPHRGLLLDPPGGPVCPLQLHLPGRLGAHKEIKGLYQRYGIRRENMRLVRLLDFTANQTQS